MVIYISIKVLEGDLIQVYLHSVLVSYAGPIGGWSKWSDFGPCDSQCLHVRQRFCTAEDRKTKCPEANVYGIQTDTAKCSDDKCHGELDNWLLFMI